MRTYADTKCFDASKFDIKESRKTCRNQIVNFDTRHD